MLQLQGSNGQNGDAILINKKRIFISTVRGAAVFYNAQSACCYLFNDAEVQENYAIRNVFFQSLPCQCFITALTGNYCSNTFVFEPPEQPAYFRAQNCGVGYSA